MILKKWENLPTEMKNNDVKKYYEILSQRKISLLLRRLVDFLLALILIIFLSPIMIVIAFIIKIDSKGPILYRQERVTAYNQTFKICKFRTMVTNADKIGALVTSNGDSRITRIGKIIRKTRIDEIPQLFNIIKGEMSFVGTRPEVKSYVDQYSDEMMATLLLPAGITSLASIKFKDEDQIIDEYIATEESIDSIYIQRILPIKMQYNLKELSDIGLLYSFKIMIQTFFTVLK